MELEQDLQLYSFKTELSISQFTINKTNQQLYTYVVCVSPDQDCLVRPKDTNVVWGFSSKIRKFSGLVVITIICDPFKFT